MPPEQTNERHPCEWCGDPSIARVEITPAVYTSAGGVRRLKVHATEADVCAVHAAMVQRNKAEREAEAEAKRRERREMIAAKRKERAS